MTTVTAQFPPASHRGTGKAVTREFQLPERHVSDRLLDLFLRSTEDYAIILFDPDGRVQRWSRGAEKLFGFTARELEGTLAHEIFVPPDRQAGVPEV